MRERRTDAPPRGYAFSLRTEEFPVKVTFMSKVKDHLIDLLEKADSGGDDSEDYDFLESVPRWEPSSEELTNMNLASALDSVRSLLKWTQEKSWRVKAYGDGFGEEDFEFLEKNLRRILREHSQ